MPLRPRPRAAQSAAGPSQPAGAIDRGSRPNGPGAAPFRLWELGLPGRFLGTSAYGTRSVCAFNVQGGAEHGHFDAAAVFRAAPTATFPIVAAVAAAERAAERAAATKASAAVQAGAVTLAAQETGPAAPALALALELARHSTAFSDLSFRMDGSKSLLVAGSNSGPLKNGR